MLDIITINEQRFTLANVYIKSQCPTKRFDEFLTELQSFPNANLVIGGVFNTVIYFPPGSVPQYGIDYVPNN